MENKMAENTAFVAYSRSAVKFVQKHVVHNYILTQWQLFVKIWGHT